MAWLVDDVAEAALGPWGLLVGVGVGVGVLARKRLAPIASTAVVGALETTDRARDEIGRRQALRQARELAGSAALAAGSMPVVGRAQTTLAEVGDWWSDLYAEARAEWEAGRTADVAGATKRLERASRKAQRARDSSGRFAKKEDT